MMKKIAAAALAGLAAMMLTTTAFAGQYVGGYHLAVTDDGNGRVSSWGAGDFPVDVDLDTYSARVRINGSNGASTYNFNRRTGPSQYMSDEGWTLDVADSNNIRLITYDGIDYITR